MTKQKPRLRKRDAKWIKDRCDEIGECWIWRQALNGSGQPVTSEHRDGQRKTVLVRRLALSLALGRWPETKEIAVAKPLCMNSQCCRPDHIFAGTKKQLMKMASARGSLSSGKLRSTVAKLAARKRKTCKLDQSKVDRIRAMHAELGNCREIARRLEKEGLKICKTYVHKIVMYKAWSDRVFR